ncbi:UNVERIFIED_CONTAM: hypothetical protein GTU68_051169 [Idotea baltica]|nr:hypothetical protein [Idotea baltica]
MEFRRLINKTFLMSQKYILNRDVFSPQRLKKTQLNIKKYSINKKIFLTYSNVNINLNHPFKLFCNATLELEKPQKAPNQPHIPVLASEVQKALDLKENGVYLDMTFGAGGHTKSILESHPSIVVYALDRDPHTKRFADPLEELYPNRFHFMLGKFSDLPELLNDREIKSNFFNGVLMDLGVSSMQFDTPDRGFMLSQNGPLDMRMDGDSARETPTAANILAHIDEHSLFRVLKYYGQEKKARIISKAIIESRSHLKSFRTTKELAEFIVSITGIDQRMDKLQRFSHPATKTFQALRILVNDELNELDCGIRLAHFYLQPGGTLAAISFHSLEDTIIKRHFSGCDLDKTPDSIGGGLRKHRNSCLSTYSLEELREEILKPWLPLTKSIVTPSVSEVERNPRSRSAKLRVGSKVPTPPY